MKNTGNREGKPTGWYLERVEYMSRFLLPEREQTLRRVLASRTRYMTICAENTFHPQNASALVRHCDAFGIQDIHTVEQLCRFRPNVNIVRGTDKWVTFHRHASAEQAIASLRSDDYRIIATTPHGGCIPGEFDVEGGKFALVFGTEHEGVSSRVMDAADGSLMIPMCGFVESLNVSASAAILLHVLSEGVRSRVEGWRLGENEQAAILLEWMMQTVRDSERILAKYRPEEK